MMGTPPNEHPRAFWGADLDEAAGRLLEVIREVRPQVAVTYDPNGFYGHPDHIQAHRVPCGRSSWPPRRASRPRRSTGPPCRAASWRRAWRSSASSSDNPFAGVENAEDLPFGTPDDEIAARIDGHEYAEEKTAALRAHATQIPPSSWLFAIAGNFGAEFMGVEYYQLARGRQGARRGPHGWEEDLFAGLDVDAAAPQLETAAS